MNKQAMDDLRSPEFNAAKKDTEDTVALCASALEGTIQAARTYINLGMVYVQLKGSVRGEQWFRRALSINPNAKLDPNLATPEVKTVWAIATGTAQAPMPQCVQPVQQPIAQPVQQPLRSRCSSRCSQPSRRRVIRCSTWKRSARNRRSSRWVQRRRPARPVKKCELSHAAFGNAGPRPRSISTSRRRRFDRAGEHFLSFTRPRALHRIADDSEPQTARRSCPV